MSSQINERRRVLLTGKSFLFPDVVRGWVEAASAMGWASTVTLDAGRHRGGGRENTFRIVTDLASR